MENIKSSVVKSLDGTNIEVFPYIPYIMQDLWEMGADPQVVSDLIKKNINQNYLKVLDLGCGKGAVSIKLAKDFGYTVRGMDLVPEFIESAITHAEELGVSDKCLFETGDIRIRIGEFKKYDIVILGAIGDVFGDLYYTLKKVARTMNRKGYVVLDDCYIKDSLKTDYDRCLREKVFYDQIKSSGYEIIDEVIFDVEKIKDFNKKTMLPIKQRINKLKNKYPEKETLFLDYLKIKNMKFMYWKTN